MRRCRSSLDGRAGQGTAETHGRAPLANASEFCNRIAPQAEFQGALHDVAVVPSTAHALQLHSITSSASASSDGGTVRPSALAVLRLMTNSYCAARQIGKSAGFAPLRIRAAL